MCESRGKFPKMRALPYNGQAGRCVPEGTASKGVDKPGQQERTPPGHPLSAEWLHWASQLKVSVPSVPLIRSYGNSWTIRPARAKVSSG